MVSCWKQPLVDGNTGHKGIDVVSDNTQVGCGDTPHTPHSNSFACIRGSAMDSFIYTCYYLLPFLKQTSVMTKCLLLMQPAGGSIAARKSHPPFPFICPSPTPLSLPSLSLMVYHFLCIFPASYSPNPPNPSHSFVCICINVCNVRAHQADIVV